ncbi:hypothetical protein EOM39_00950 [Candidatus Gracilibacteria bacterium]|nr:hypothetical protein [Candidatus Gracilibacteria bacterium]
MLLENYFHILGLDISSNQKQISKRAKEILKYLAIGEIPEFENDFYFTKNYRNENLVKLALDNLSKPKEKLINVFFWFDIESEKDKQIFTLTNEKKYEKAIELIKQQGNKKNLAIMYLLFLLESSMNIDYSKYLEESINIFKEISEDNKFWISFEKKYLLFDDISTNKDLIKEFRKDLGKYLSNIYYDISLKLGDDNVQKIFHDNFKNTKGKKSNEQIEKITLELNKIALELEALNINDDGILSNEKKNFIKNSLNKIQDILNKTIEVGVYDSSEIIIVRDRLAKIIRSISLDFFNYANDKKKSFSFIEIALNICGTDGLKHKINEEYKTIASNIKLLPVIKLLDTEDYIGASKKIDELNLDELNKEDKKLLFNLKKRSIFGRLGKGFMKGKEFFENEDYSNALKYFTSTEELAKENIKLFEGINQKALNELINSIKDYFGKIGKGELNTKEVFEYIDDLRDKVIKQLSEEDGYVFIFYIDSISYGYLSDAYLNPKKSEQPLFLFTLNGCGVSIYGDTTYVTFIWFPFIPISCWKVTDLGNGKYQFYGKKEMPTWKRVWQVLGIIGTMILLSNF